MKVMLINNRPYLATKGADWTTFLYLGRGYTAAEVTVYKNAVVIDTYDEQDAIWRYCGQLEPEEAQAYRRAALLV